MKLQEFAQQSDFINQHRTIVEAYQKISKCIRKLEEGRAGQVYKINLDLHPFQEGVTKLDIMPETLLKVLKSCKECYKQKLERNGIVDD